MTLLKKKAEVLALIIILPHPPSFNVGDMALASDNMTRINIELGKGGLLFSWIRKYVSTIFSIIVGLLIIKYSCSNCFVQMALYSNLRNILYVYYVQTIEKIALYFIKIWL